MTGAEVGALIEAARIDREAAEGVLDPQSADILRENPDACADGMVSFVAYPRFVAPMRPYVDPEAAEERSVEAAREFGEYYTSLQQRRQEARSVLEEDLIFEGFYVTGGTERGVRVEVEADELDLLVRFPSVAAVRLDDSRFLPPLDRGAASGNVYMDFDIFRAATPIAFDGNGFDITGSGGKVGIGLIEWETRFRVAPGNMGIVWKDSANTCTISADCSGGASTSICLSGQCRDIHGTAVASVLGSSDGGDAIGAPGARMYYCGGIDNDWADCSAWWSSNGIHIASTSVSGPTISALMRDEAVRYDNIAVTNYATNDGNNAVHTTCASPNVICVGNFDHNDAVPPKMNLSSGWQNFSSTDREQPDIVAPGTAVRVFDAATNSFQPKWGTSYATLAVASAIALLYDMSQTFGGPKYYPYLQNYPELTKALLMAAATEDADGQGAVSNPGSSPDERDGAGALSMDALDDIWRSSRWSVIWYTPSSANPHAWKTVHLNANQRLRVFIAWSRCPSNTITAKNSDLSLSIRRPDGVVPWTDSDSFDQTYEGFEYTATMTGPHTIELGQWFINSCNGTTGEYVGLAYHVQN